MGHVLNQKSIRAAFETRSLAPPGEEDNSVHARGVFMAISVVAYTRSERANFIQKLLQVLAQQLHIAPRLNVIFQELMLLTSDRSAQRDIQDKFAVSASQTRVRSVTFDSNRLYY